MFIVFFFSMSDVVFYSTGKFLVILVILSYLSPRYFRQTDTETDRNSLVLSPSSFHMPHHHNLNEYNNCSFSDRARGRVSVRPIVTIVPGIQGLEIQFPGMRVLRIQSWHSNRPKFSFFVKYPYVYNI